jgi:hypothetical protein
VEGGVAKGDKPGKGMGETEEFSPRSPPGSPKTDTSPLEIKAIPSMASSGPLSMEVTRAGPQSPEVARMRTSLNSMYSSLEREELVGHLSPKQKSQPIMEALRSSGFAFDSDSDEDGGGGDGGGGGQGM